VSTNDVGNNLKMPVTTTLARIYRKVSLSNYLLVHMLQLSFFFLSFSCCSKVMPVMCFLSPVYVAPTFLYPVTIFFSSQYHQLLTILFFPIFFLLQNTLVFLLPLFRPRVIRNSSCSRFICQSPFFSFSLLFPMF
jgi:hypothetical protein